MLTVAALIVFFGGVIALQVPVLIKKQMYRDLTVFSLLMLLGMVYSFSLALDLPTFNPIRYLESIFAPATGFVDNMLSDMERL